MDYPLHLIPNLTNEIIQHPNGDDFLGVWVLNNKELRDEDGKLDAGVIEINRIPGFSTNKIPESVINDLNILFIGDNANFFNRTGWIVGEEGAIPNSDDFKFQDDRLHYFIKILDINGHTDEYHNPPDKEQTIYNFTVHVVHKPLVANYWHFELNVTSPDHNLSTTGGKWRELVFSAIRDKIQEIAVFEL